MKMTLFYIFLTFIVIVSIITGIFVTAFDKSSNRIVLKPKEEEIEVLEESSESEFTLEPQIVRNVDLEHTTTIYLTQQMIQQAQVTRPIEREAIQR